MLIDVRDARAFWCRVAVLAGAVVVAVVSPGLAAERHVKLRYLPVAGMSGVCAPQNPFSSYQVGLPIDGRWLVVLRLRGRSTCGPDAVLLDLRSGRRRVIHAPAGEPLAVGGGRILWRASRSGALTSYDIGRRRWDPLSCGSCGSTGVQDAAFMVGRRWMRFDYDLFGDCGDLEHNSCGPHVTELYDIGRGKLVTDPRSSPSQDLDLDAGDPVRTLCSPLTEPSGGFFLQLGDGFALAVAYPQGPYGFTLLFLQRCGESRVLGLSQYAFVPFVADSQAVLFAGGDILLLPWRRLIAASPASDLSDLGLAGRTIYAIDGRGQLRAARLPR